ncbi:MAG: RecQ family ATP-dependent DNA helicase [Bacteroides sp.]
MQYREEIPLVSQLNKWFGFEKFKGQQESIIRNLLQGRDTFVLMPTGGGKSLCYQLPALILPGTAIIVSPLIALMKNQVDRLRASCGNDNVTHFLNSSLQKKLVSQVKDDVLNGVTKLLYVAPETLNKPENIEFLQQAKISFYAIDEAHCISEWGHDFRPDYRNIRNFIDKIGKAPVIALTATATPKVQDDIQKSLGITDAVIFRSSFNRPNLFYSIRPKVNAIREITKYIKDNAGKSGIIYCISRKNVEELTNTLQINGIRALPYHAGLDTKTRSYNQDAFLQEECDVIVATIAFGMGIDKPDVRYVIHYDMPKSLEGYYQETGRAGRDGREGHCIAFYSEKDIRHIFHFFFSKSQAEQEIGKQLLLDTTYYAQGGDCRRKMLLQYFGEQYDVPNCEHCDNCCSEKHYFEGKDDLLQILQLLQAIGDGFRAHHLITLLRGIKTQDSEVYGHSQLPLFGSRKDTSDFFLNSIIRQALLHGFIRKDIQRYGLIALTPKGSDFIENPYSIQFVKDHEYNTEENEEPALGAPEIGGIDNELFQMLKNLTIDEAKKYKVQPFVIFQETSLEEMTIHYPISFEELQNITGVSASKAKRYGQPFIDLIKQYVEENEIERPSDFVMKVAPTRFQQKVALIHAIDRKTDLHELADMLHIDLSELIEEIENLVISKGMKLNIGYYVDQEVDSDLQEEIYDYFKNEAQSLSIQEACEAFRDMHIDEEIIRLVRIRFFSEVAN